MFKEHLQVVTSQPGFLSAKYQQNKQNKKPKRCLHFIEFKRTSFHDPSCLFKMQALPTLFHNGPKTFWDFHAANEKRAARQKVLLVSLSAHFNLTYSCLDRLPYFYFQTLVTGHLCDKLTLNRSTYDSWALE